MNFLTLYVLHFNVLLLVVKQKQSYIVINWHLDPCNEVINMLGLFVRLGAYPVPTMNGLRLHGDSKYSQAWVRHGPGFAMLL